MNNIFFYDEDIHINGNEILQCVKNGADTICFVNPEEWTIKGLFENIQDLLFIEAFCEKHNIKLIWITCGNNSEKFVSRHALHNLNFNILFWDNYFSYQIVENYLAFPYNYTSFFPQPKDLNKHFISLNHRAHYHRCKFIDKMYLFNLFKFGYISWHDKNNIGKYNFKYWTPKKMYLNDNWEFSDVYLQPPPEFKNSLFSVIAETTLNVLDISEKTYMAIFHHKPFLVYGHPFLHAFLQSKGFLLYDEVIDYNFDSIVNDDVRLTELMNQVAKITKYNIKDLYYLLKPKIEYNFRVMISNILNKDYLHQDLYKFCHVLNDESTYNLKKYKRLLSPGFRGITASTFANYLEKTTNL